MADALLGQVALVTGASSGIGRATALALAAAGCDVALNYFSLDDHAHDTAEVIRATYGRRAKLYPVDVSENAAVEEMVLDVVAHFGRLDTFISSAVFSEREPFLTADIAGMHRTVNVSLWGALYGLRACCRQFVKQGGGGTAVIVSSPHGQIAFPNCMAYNMAKAGLDMMMKTAATELLPEGIRINAVYPGWTDTPGERKFLADEAIKKAAAGLPMGRLATPEEIAQGVLFLCTPAAAYMTGSILHLDGGLFLPWWSQRGTGTL